MKTAVILKAGLFIHVGVFASIVIVLIMLLCELQEEVSEFPGSAAQG